MARYVIERQFLVPMYEHIFVEAQNFEEAYRQALDDFAQPWGDDAKLDWDNSRSTTVARAVEIPEDLFPEFRSTEDADHNGLSNILYDSGLDPLPIADEFADPLQEDRGKIGFS